MKADPKLTHVTKKLKHNSPLIACRFDPKGRYVFAGSHDYAVHRWDLKSEKKTTFDTDWWVRAIGFSPDGETLFTGGYDGRLIWWPATADEPKPIRVVEAHTGTAPWIRSLAVSPDGALLATGGNDGLVKLWSTADGKLVRELKGHDSNVYSTLFHPKGEFILSGDLMGNIHQWEVKSGKRLRTFDAKALHSYNGGQQVHYGGVRTLAVSPDEKFLAVGGLYKGTNPLGAVNEPLVPVFEWESLKKKQSHVMKGVKGVAWRVIYHPDGFLIGVSGGSGGGFIASWTLGQDKQQFQMKMPVRILDMDLHPDGLQLATAHFEQYILISSMTPKPDAKKKS